MYEYAYTQTHNSRSRARCLTYTAQTERKREGVRARERVSVCVGTEKAKEGEKKSEWARVRARESELWRKGAKNRKNEEECKIESDSCVHTHETLPRSRGFFFSLARARPLAPSLCLSDIPYTRVHIHTNTRTHTHPHHTLTHTHTHTHTHTNININTWDRENGTVRDRQRRDTHECQQPIELRLFSVISTAQEWTNR